MILWIAFPKARTPLKITLAAFLVGDRSGMRLGDHDCCALAGVIRIVAPGPACVSRETIRTMHDEKSRHGEQQPCVPKTDSQASSHGFAPIAGVAKMRLVSPHRAQGANQISVRPPKATRPCRRRCGGTARRRGSPTRGAARLARVPTGLAGLSLSDACGLVEAFLRLAKAEGQAARACVREPQGRVISALCQSRRETESRQAQQSNCTCQNHCPCVNRC